MALPCNNLNLNLYRVFYTVAKTKSFSESSRTLHISQPAISKHIQNLEYELNTLLFYRTNRGIDLTPEAKELLVYVEKAWNYLMLGEKQLQESKELKKGKVSLGTSSFIGIYFMNDYIKKFMKEHNGIIVKMDNHEEKKLFELLHQHSLDLLIIPEEEVIPKDFKVVPLREERYCFAYNANNFRVDKENSLRSIFKYPVLLPTKITESRKRLEDLLNDNGISSNPVMELQSKELMVNYIREGLGVGYILESIAKKENFEIISLEQQLPVENIVLVYPEATLTSSTKEFINLITKIEG